MHHFKLVLLFLNLAIVHHIQSANILFYFGTSTYSHRIIVWPLVEKLVEAGHNVTFAQPFRPKIPNPKVHELFPMEFILEEERAAPHDLLQYRVEHGKKIPSAAIAQLVGSMSLKSCERLFTNHETQEWIKSGISYDLIILDNLYNDCAYGLAYKFNTTKTILFGTSTILSWQYDELALPTETSWIPDMFVTYSYPLNLWQKLETNFLILYHYFYRQWYFLPQLEEILRVGLNETNMPGLNELSKTTNLFLLNNHFTEEYSRALPASVIPVGGMHCDDEFVQTKIPDQEMERFCNESDVDGFIYVSFGSVLKGLSLASKTVQTKFFNSFRKLKTRFVLNWKGERPANMPSNVFTSGWMPQQALLAHPNIKGFISHAGLLSIQEAIHFGVPLILFPIFAEQDYNAGRIASRSRGLVLDISTFTESDLDSALNQILTNNTYKLNMKQASKLFNDRPQSPVQLAMYWTEYILRHDDTSLLKPLSIHQSWYERRLLDVVVLVLILFGAFITAFYLIGKFIFKTLLLFNNNNSEAASSKLKLQ